MQNGKNTASLIIRLVPYSRVQCISLSGINKYEVELYTMKKCLIKMIPVRKMQRLAKMLKNGEHYISYVCTSLNGTDMVPKLNVLLSLK